MWWIVISIVGGVSLLTFAIIKCAQYAEKKYNEDETNNFIEN